MSMNQPTEFIKGNWIELKGKIKKEWGELTDDELEQVNGSKDVLVGKLIAKYNVTEDEARRQIDRIWI